VKLPGCRGIEAPVGEYSDPNGIPATADDVPTRVSVSFEPGYLPSIDGCILGDVIRQRGGAPSVPVSASARRPSSRASSRCAAARPRGARAEL
jgi:hypothetical protein